ncbi:glycosyltransferase family 32 protein [Bacteroides sp. AN502(2024)]|uniref:glycosyltransferase family 32 protein n=1 Tax=Bacteroides sp. AN502(2024) TaxID=3160599 RepID=UPI00351141AB
MAGIPRIIHQIWSGIENPLPEKFRALGETWKEHHPDWKYELWDHGRINTFILDFYPQYWNVYQNFKYNIQRWDAIRYLILDKIGGIYADFDTECLKSLDPFLKDKECCFSVEPQEHAAVLGLPLLINNAIMMSVPNHAFMKRIIIEVFERNFDASYSHRNLEILDTTGPLMLTRTFERYGKGSNVFLMPAENISPFTQQDTMDYLNNRNMDILENKLEKAYAIHYF